MTPSSPLPLTREVVFIGGGHAHALALRSWGMAPLPGVRLTLINPGPTAPYSGMLPGLVAGHYKRPDLEIDLVKLARFAGARLILGHATGIDRDARLIEVPGRPPVFYDIASIDIGISSDLPSLEGFTEHAVPAKPLGPFAERWEAHVARARAGAAGPRVLVIGAGVAGVELALATAHRLKAEAVAGAEVILLEAGDTALRDIGKGARAALLAQMQAHGVILRTNARIARCTAEGVVLDTGEVIEAALTIGAAGARPQPWLEQTGLHLTDGFVDVGPDLTALNDPRIYAVGDCAHLTHAPRPKAGVYAVREAPFLAQNIRADLTGSPRRPYRPQRDYLKLISTGHKHAVADKLGLRLEGDWLWRWKNRIDRTFMDKFHILPEMPVPALPRDRAQGIDEMLAGNDMPCGGCAAKPGLSVLQGGLSGLPAAGRADVERGVGDDAAVVTVGGARQVLTVDQFRAFTDDPYLLTRIAAMHAMGDIWAMGAEPQAALATLILPRLRDRMQQEMLREIMAAAQEAFAAAGADLVGGHTSVGPELAVGFAVTGLLARPAIGLDGAQPGDALILTRPIGSGTLFAAEMQGKADGADIAAALDLLSQPQDEAARKLAPLAHAMTDVTGYGLAGHLLSILRASGAGAVLDPGAVPLMQGALDLAGAGIRSSLFPQNKGLLDGIEGATRTDPRHALLVDPQTAGGLLAALPEQALPDLLPSLPGAARIGTITEGPPKIRLT